MSTAVTVVDYGLGNLHSVMKALRHHGADVHLTSDPDAVRRAERLVLPGVGAFADGARGLAERGLADPILDYVTLGRPLLGICLGMQLLLSASSEFGEHRGLGVIPGRVTEIPRQPGFKVPHIGWNRLLPTRPSAWDGTALQRVPPGEMVYFVHSFAAVPEHPEDCLADVEYGGHRLAAAVRKDHVLGCQFHPEKSGAAGLAILAGFLES